MNYEDLLIDAEMRGIKVKEIKMIPELSGLYADNRILINSSLMTDNEKKCILAEEIGHHETSYGNILDANDISSVKQELAARSWGYQHVISIEALISAYKYGVQNTYEAAEYLTVPEKYLNTALKRFRQIYGNFVETASGYRLYFNPYLKVIKL